MNVPSSRCEAAASVGLAGSPRERLVTRSDGGAAFASGPREGLDGEEPSVSDACARPVARLADLQPMLGAYLRLLWGVAPRLVPASDREVGAGGPPDRPSVSRGAAALRAGEVIATSDGLPVLHLPAQWAGTAEQTAADRYRAAAAHAAAHLVYSRHRFDRRGRPPITQALIGLLEDARVEWLACRELPGLRALWLPAHTASTADGEGFEALMARLARALLDPTHADPHPWVAKGRALFFLDEAGAMLALRQGEDLARAASRLGHDIGQRRLGFNARTHRPAAGYRDDNRCLWTAEPLQADEHAAAVERPASVPRSPSGPEAEPPAARRLRYPEWDRLIGRHRPAWCTVHEDLPAIAQGEVASGGRDASEPARLVARVRQALRRGRGSLQRASRREHEGEELDLEALVEAAVGRRHGGAFNERVHRCRRPRAGGRAVLLLIDVSASSGPGPCEGAIDALAGGSARAATAGQAGASDGERHPPLALARRSAALIATALAAEGQRCAIAAFSSQGRSQVRVLRVKDFDAPFDAVAQQRLAALRSGWSTRLGAALRHGSALLGPQRAGCRHVLLLSDAEAHDIDVHDRRYLAADARQAVRDARRHGVQVRCLALAPPPREAAQRVFAAGQWRLLTGTAALPRLLPALLG